MEDENTQVAEETVETTGAQEATETVEVAAEDTVETTVTQEAEAEAV